MKRSGDDRIVVLESTNPPDGTTRYIDQVVTFAEPRFDFRYLSVGNVLRRSDVFHVHWPEVLVRGRSGLETALRCLLLRAMLFLMAWRKTAIVRTLHNLTPHEAGGSLERRTLQRLDDRTDLFVAINPLSEAPRAASVLIPHGHYRDRFADLPHRPPVRGRLVFAGIIRPYKGVEQLIATFQSMTDPEVSLHLVGKPTPELREKIESAAAADPRIRATFGFVPDEELVDELTSAALVCLPYSDLHNSGMLLVALSLGRPVLVPDTPTTRVLAEEVGEGWVHRFTAPLTSHDLHEALAQVSESPPAAPPHLEDRGWDVVARRYGEAFDAAIEAKRSTHG